MQSLIVVIAVTMATSAVAAEATATRLDGTTVAGELTNWDGQALALSTNDGPVQLSAANLLSLRWSPTASIAGLEEKARLLAVVELLDGSLLAIDDFVRKGHEATLKLRAASPDNAQNLTLADRAVVAARLQPLAEAVAKQWDEIRKQDFASDVLVLIKRNGESLDYIEGTIGDVTAERIEFKLDDQMRRVERSKVAGVIFYRSEKAPDAEPLCVLEGPDSLRVSVASLSLRDGLLHVKTVGGVKLELPTDAISSADFSAGKVVFLSDLDLATEERTSLVGLPGGAKLAAEYGRPRRDQSAFGGPLTLWIPTSDSSGSAGHMQTFGRGLAVRSRTTLVYRVPKGFTRLLGLAGIEPTTRGDGSVRLTISGDERPLVDTELAGNQSPQKLELDITGVKRVKIVVDYGKNLDTGDWVNLCDVRMVK
jgi:hypothetical protein